MVTKAKLSKLLSLRQETLIFKDLNLINLRYVDFSGLKLVNVCFDDCFLSCADFTGTYIKDASFQNVSARNCVFKRSSIQSSIFTNTDFDKSNFYGAEIVNSNFNLSNFSYSKFTFANIMDSKFINVNFKYVDLHYGYLNEVTFIDSNLESAIIPEITKEQIVSFFNSNLNDTDYEYMTKTQNDIQNLESAKMENDVEKSVNVTKKTIVKFMR